MNSYSVINDLKEHLNAHLKDWFFRVPDEDGEEKYSSPNIFIGALPPKKKSLVAGQGKQDESDPSPFIIIRPTTADTSKSELSSGQDHVLNVAIIVGIYSDESLSNYGNGVHDVINFSDKIELELLSRPFWADDFYYRNDGISVTYGLGKAIDAYEAGIQIDAPFFACVIQASFTHKLPPSQFESLSTW